ncbi:5-methylcytosine restriction system specificity protein McrC [Winogradskyella helgolandensis]|uniref:5-methylcytosine restriction system specificity protein McrC n=1 Tax=Winogradskyella helgolandensis TaxID=2697010 RepID=UPI0015CB7E82|nr:hypothetical protein [Winogradskyella helgolandensis]
MKIIEIVENNIISLDENDLIELEQIKNKFPDLPFEITESKLICNDYIIGEIQLKDKLFRIIPRHDALNLSHFFEMLLFIGKIKSQNLVSSSNKFNQSFGIQALVENYINICEELIKYGMTGTFHTEKTNSFKPSGKLIVSDYNKKLIPFQGIKTEIDIYNLNNNANQILKAALIKIKDYKFLNREYSYRLSSILSNFQNIKEYTSSYDNIKRDIDSFFSTNKYYPLCLEYAFKILLDYKLGYDSEGETQWNAFLENSNDIFEKYVRTILERELDSKVTKWAKPVEFAQLKYNAQIGVKSYAPDIIIDYIGGIARAVFDVKNKNFSPKHGSLSDSVSVADIYQMIFYAQQLNCGVCGLIYPTSENFDSIKLELKGNDIQFFLISIDMSMELFERNKNLIQKITKCLLYT